MGAVSGYMLFDPYAVERVPLTASGPVEWGVVEKKIRDFIVEIFKRNYDAGLRGEAAFSVCAIHRSKPEIHRWFNLNTTVSTSGLYGAPPRSVTMKDGHNVEVRGLGQYGGYAGAFNHAEELLSGMWRVGTLEEAAERRKQDEAEAARVLAERAPKVPVVQAVLGDNVIDGLGDRIVTGLKAKKG